MNVSCGRNSISFEFQGLHNMVSGMTSCLVVWVTPNGQVTDGLHASTPIEKILSPHQTDETTQ